MNSSSSGLNSSTASSKMKGSLWIGLSLLILCGVAVWWYYEFSSPSSARPARPPATVTVAEAKTETWQQRRTGIGTVRAIQGTDLTSELAGKVIAIKFKSGTRVRAGEVLVELDASREKAELKSIEAELKQAQSDLSRARELLKKDAATQETYERAATEVERLNASAARQRAIIEKKEILAPFSGELGIRQVNLGQYLSPGTAVSTLQQIEPIYVDFDLPEQDAGVIAEGQSVQITVDAYPEQQFHGKVIAINPLVAETTRSFTVRAELANEERKLRPGMFADVIVKLSQQRDVIVIPQTAIAFNAYGKSVFFVRKENQKPASNSDKQPDGKTSRSHSSASGNHSQPASALVARRAFIQTGERRGHRIEIQKGVEPGDRVVTSGQLKIEDGSPVKISETDAARDVAVKTTEP